MDINEDGLISGVTDDTNDDVGGVDGDKLLVDMRLLSGVMDESKLFELIGDKELSTDWEESGEQLASKVELAGQVEGQLHGEQDDEPINEKKPAGQTVLLTDAKGQ